MDTQQIDPTVFKNRLEGYLQKPEVEKPMEQEIQKDVEKPTVQDSSVKTEGSLMIIYVDRQKVGLMKSNQSQPFPIDSEFKIVKNFDYKNLDEKSQMLEKCAEFMEAYENDPSLSELRQKGAYYIIDGRPIKIKIKKQIVIE